ncbi:MAG: D-tyrosyl-tRNA(Tyr) deacylase [Halanaerobiales bacterium]|nr:D-tyrosyl-tRNA(Tyr) deacylase [Halanaerobiales bacterium]
MRAVVQRVKKCEVKVNNDLVGSINSGLLIFLGIGKDDAVDDIDYMIDKIVNLRIFEDDQNKMNLAALDLNKEIMIVSQFTLYGDCRKGRRPSFFDAARPDQAEKIYNIFIDKFKKYDLNIQTGEFQTMMDIDLINDGPVTLLIDSKKNF